MSASATLDRRIVIALIGLVSAVSSGDYYFSSSEGLDFRTKQQAQSPLTPWRSFAPLDTLRLNPGDRILLKRGDVWRQTLNIRQSGTATEPITVEAYGTASTLPEIRGTDTIRGSLRNGIRTASIPNGIFVNQVFIDTVLLPVSRYPDTGWIFGSEMDTTRIIAPSLANSDWSQASIHIRSIAWAHETRRIVAGKSGILIFDRPTMYAQSRNPGFYITNDSLSFTRSQNQSIWYQQFGTNIIRWKDPTGTLPKIEVSVRQTGISIWGASHINVKNIKVFGTIRQAIATGGSSQRVTNCIILFPGTYGIKGHSFSSQFDSNMIEAASNSAIYITGGQNKVYSNTAERTSVLSVIGPNGIDSVGFGGRGIAIFGDSAVIRKNIVDSSGYDGIAFRGINSIIDSNIIQHSCATVSDCGGIHTWTGIYSNPGSMGSRIRRNIVFNSIGYLGGLWSPTPGGGNGIYLDDGSHDIRVDSNIIFNNWTGVYLHNSQRDTITGNILFANRLQQIYLQRDLNSGSDDMQDNYITHNHLVRIGDQNDTVQKVFNTSQTKPFAQWKKNTICSDMGVSYTCRQDGLLLSSTPSLSSDHESLGNELIGNLSSPNWYSWPTKSSLSSSSPLGTGPNLNISVTDNDRIQGLHVNYTQPFATQKNANYLLTISGKSDIRQATATVTIHRSSAQNEPITASQEIHFDTISTTHTTVISALESADTARFYIHLNSSSSSLSFNTISLKKIPESIPFEGKSKLIFVSPPLGSYQKKSLWVFDPSDYKPKQRTVSGSIVWINEVGEKITMPSSSLVPFQGIPTYSLSEAVIMPNRVMTASIPLKVSRRNSKFIVEGSDSPIRVVDVQGRLVTTLLPNPTGTIEWIPTKGIHGQYIIHSKNGTHSVVIPN